MGPLYRPLLCLALCVLACSSSSSTNVAHDTGLDASVMREAAPPASDASLESAPSDAESDGPEDARPDVLPSGLFGRMTFYELASTQAKELALSVSFGPAFFHDYDDRQGGTGCIADHFDATSRPLPRDVDAGLIRVSGFLGGTTLAGDDGSNPITCAIGGSYYGCTYPEGANAFAAQFAPTSMPFGPAPISFAGNGGNDFSAFYVSGPPNVGTLSVGDDLTALRYDPSRDTVLHPTCASGCPGARIAVEVTAFPLASAADGWPYPSVGVVRCVFEAAATVAVPHGAIAAALTYDLSLDAVETAVVLLPSARLQTRDFFGNSFTADVGRGVVGTSPL